MIQFANPQWFWLMNSIPLLLAWYAWRHLKQQRTLLVPGTATWSNTPATAKIYTRHGMFALQLVAIAALIVAMARPQAVTSKQNVASEGLDIMLAIDISGSMASRDFVPSRLEAAKKVAIDFIEGRPNDRIGVVFFAGEAYTGCPITIDHRALEQIISDVKTGDVADGTAIGLGLGLAANRLTEQPSRDKIIILVTDGENNAGDVKPSDAARLVRSLKIHNYCIGIFSPASEKQPISANDSTYAALGGPTAESTLIRITEITGGKYFRASNEKSLASIYGEINALAKTRVDVVSYNRYAERFYLFAIIAAISIFSSVVLRYTLFRTAP